MVDLGAYEEPVAFDDGVADALRSAASALSGTLSGQAASRSSWAATASTDFEGHYADVFDANARAACDDCSNIASALDALAADVQTMKDAAASERDRRRQAKEWADRQKDEWAPKSWIDDHLGLDKPPAGPPETPVVDAQAPTVATWSEPAQGQAGGVSSARPDDLRAYSSNVTGANDTVTTQKGALDGALSDFAERCSWCSIDASGITTALAAFGANNTNETRWVDTVAAAFEAAGGSGAISTVSDAALDASLQAAGVTQTRQPVDVTAPTIQGDPQTSGYADDPVNTTTGNFVEPETDLSFDGGAASLGFDRMYNSLSAGIGAFGPGWASTADQRLLLDDDGATWIQPSGRHIVFPRLAGSWDRAAGDTYWLHHTTTDDAGGAADPAAADAAAAADATGRNTAASAGDAALATAVDGADAAAGAPGATGDASTGDAPTTGAAGGAGVFVVSDNAGGRWVFDRAGRPVWTGRGAGTRVDHRWDGDRLVGLSHERGRAITIEWDGQGTRITALAASDGRRVDYDYDPAGRLTEAASAGGARRYGWDEAGLICRVVDPDGVVEVVNAYNGRGQVTSQRSRFGRVSHYTYLPGGVTQVADEDGSRANTWIHDQRGRLVGMVDTDGNRQSIGWDQWGNRVQITGRDGQTTVYRYDARSRLITRQEASGARTDYEWDGLDRVVQVTVTDTTSSADADGSNGNTSGRAGSAVATGGESQSGRAVTSYEYEGAGRNPSTVTDPEGGVTRLVWDQNLLTEVVDPAGVRVRLGYDGHGDLVSTTNAAGDTARLARDETGRVVAAITPLGHRTEYRYDKAGRLASRQDPDGALWRYEHTTGGRLSAVVDPDGGRTVTEYGPGGVEEATTDPLGRRLEQEWDDLGNLAGVRLPDGREWSYVHDGLSRLTETVDPAGGLWRREYDVNGMVAATVDPTGVRRGLAWAADGSVTVSDASGTARVGVDGLGRPVSVSVSSAPAPGASGPDGPDARVVVRDLCGRPVEALDADGGLTRLMRDAAGRLVEEISPAGRSSRYEWDRCGRLSAVIGPDGARTTMAYDAASRLIAQDGPAGPVRIGYDPCGRVTTVTAPGRGKTTWGYDRAGRVRSVRSPAWGLVRFVYDPAGQLTAVTNALGGVTRYDYDECGRLVQVTDPLGHVTRRTYTAADRVETLVDPLGRTTRAGYDAAGRQLWQSDGTGERLAFGWDGAGRLERVAAGGQGQPGRACCELSRPGRRVLRVAGPGGARDEFVFDRAGRLVRHARGGRVVGEWSWDPDGACTGFIGPDGQRVRYGYDDAGALVGVEGTAFGPVTVRRDTAGRLTGMDGPGLAQSWDRDEAGRVIAYRRTENGVTTSSRVSRDGSGRVTAVDGPGETVRYGYDPAGQLARVEGPDGRCVSFTWDRAGRLARRTVRTASGESEVTVYRYDPAGQLVATDGPGGPVRYTWDAAGRRTGQDGPDGRWSYTWAPSGHLTALTEQGPHGARTWWISRDGLGLPRRVGEVDLSWDLSGPVPAVTGFGSHTVAGLPGALAVDGALTGAGWRPARPAGEDDPWAPPPPVVEAGGVRLGAAGAVGLGGLELLGARVHDPATFSFLSPDPLDQPPLAPWAANPYSYAANDPLAFTDPTGLKPLTDADLEAYKHDHGGLTGWIADHKDYLIGGAMVIAGGVLMATGIGGPLGGMLIGAGADTIIQRATTGQVDYGQVAVSGLLGAAGGGAAGALLKGGGRLATELGATGLRTAITTGAASGTASGAGGSGYGYLTGPGPHTVSGFLTSTATGAVEGGLLGAAGGAAGHGLSTTGKNVLGHLEPTPTTPQGTSSDTIAEMLNSASQPGRTAGVLDIDGELTPLTSGRPSPPNYIASGHVEGQAAMIMRQQQVQSATVYHDNPNGICGYCYSQLPTLLPEGAALDVVPPAGTVPPSNRWHNGGPSFIGNSSEPKPWPR